MNSKDEFPLLDFFDPKKMIVTKEWAKLFLENWNRAVELWDGGALFYSWKQGGGYWEYQIKEQQEYARLCCTWMLPNGFQEPHVLAHDMPEGCDCFHCVLGM